MTIFKTKRTEFIFGAFTTATWDSSNHLKSDPNAFLFSLTNKDNKPCKMKIDENLHKYAILCKSSNGVSFGYSNYQDFHNIHIFSFAGSILCCTRLGHTYKHPQYGVNSNEADRFLTGSRACELSEIEVYQKEK